MRFFEHKIIIIDKKENQMYWFHQKCTRALYEYIILKSLLKLFNSFFQIHRKLRYN